MRGLALELLNEAHDPAQLQQAWALLDDSERAMPELAIHAASRLMSLHGDAALARSWLLPVWERMLEPRSELGDNLRIKLITRARSRAWTRWTPTGWRASRPRSQPARAMPSSSTWPAWPA